MAEASRVCPWCSGIVFEVRGRAYLLGAIGLGIGFLLGGGAAMVLTASPVREGAIVAAGMSLGLVVWVLVFARLRRVRWRLPAPPPGWCVCRYEPCKRCGHPRPPGLLMLVAGIIFMSTGMIVLSRQMPWYGLLIPVIATVAVTGGIRLVMPRPAAVWCKCRYEG